MEVIGKKKKNFFHDLFSRVGFLSFLSSGLEEEGGGGRKKVIQTAMGKINS